MTIDKVSFGVVLGLVLPPLTAFFFYYFSMSKDVDVWQFFQWLVKISYAASLIAVSCLSNLALFMGFIYSNKLNISRGIFMSTLFWLMVVLVFKFFIQD